MSCDSLTWISCAQAERLVSDLIGDGSDRSAAFLTLLEFTRTGLVRINAAKLEMNYIHSEIPEGECDISNNILIGSVDGDMLMDGIIRLYTHGVEEREFINFNAGTFKFWQQTIRRLKSRDTLYSNYFGIFGLKFSREDIIRHFDIKNCQQQRLQPELQDVTLPFAKASSVNSTALAVKECEQWLLEQFSAPAAENQTKKDFWKLASTRFQDRLSMRGFISAWSTATRAFPERSQPGRKSNRRNDTPI